MTQSVHCPTAKAHGKKDKKKSTISPEELAMRLVVAEQRKKEKRETAERLSRLSDDERDEIKKQEQTKKDNAFEERWQHSHSARMQFCRYASLACLVLTPLRLDPNIGTASCQQYAMLSVLLHNKLRHALSTEVWQVIEQTCNDFLGAAAIEDPRTSLLPPVNFVLPKFSPDLEAFRYRCETIFTESQLRYLQLALLHWESSVVSYDEFGQACRSRGNASLGKHEAQLRSEFSCLADDLYAEETAALCGKESLVEAYRRSTSEYYMDKERKFPIKCPSVFNTFNINNHMAWDRDLIVAIGMTRVGMTNNGGVGETELSGSQISYRLGFCDIFYYRKGSSGFNRIETPTEEERSQACLFFECVGTSFDNGANSGMFSLDKIEFRQFFENVDPAWLFMSWAAGHPDHAQRAEKIEPLHDVLKKIHGPETRNLHRDSFGLERLDFSLSLGEQATPREILHHGICQATACRQIGDSYFNEITVKKDEAVPRTTQELYFHIVHVYASTGRLEEAKQRKIKQNHAAHSNTRLGRYIFTAGKSGHSCVNRTRAAALQVSSNRLEEYVAEYPEHQIFCPVEKSSGVEKACQSGTRNCGLGVERNGLRSHRAVISVR